MLVAIDIEPYICQNRLDIWIFVAQFLPLPYQLYRFGQVDTLTLTCFEVSFGNKIIYHSEAKYNRLLSPGERIQGPHEERTIRIFFFPPERVNN